MGDDVDETNKCLCWKKLVETVSGCYQPEGAMPAVEIDWLAVSFSLLRPYCWCVGIGRRDGVGFRWCERETAVDLGLPVSSFTNFDYEKWPIGQKQQISACVEWVIARVFIGSRQELKCPVEHLVWMPFPSLGSLSDPFHSYFILTGVGVMPVCMVSFSRVVWPAHMHGHLGYMCGVKWLKSLHLNWFNWMCQILVHWKCSFDRANREFVEVRKRRVVNRWMLCLLL